MVLCDIEGLTYEEIAEVLDLKLGTVRSRIHRGRAMLRKALAHRAPAEPPVEALLRDGGIAQPDRVLHERGEHLPAEVEAGRVLQLALRPEAVALDALFPEPNRNQNPLGPF